MLAQAKMEYTSALARMGGVSVAKERLKNVLFNHFEELIDAALENISLREEVDALDAALKEADEELKSKKTKTTAR